MVRSALCAEVRNGVLYVFLPPVPDAADYLELTAAIESTAAQLGMPVLIEGYPPPYDPRLEEFHITPDPGVIEVNVQPATLTVSGKSFALFTQRDAAWLLDSTQNDDLAGALRAGSTVTIEGTSEKGILVTETFSLSGATAASRAIGGC